MEKLVSVLCIAKSVDLEQVVVPIDIAVSLDYELILGKEVPREYHVEALPQVPSVQCLCII